MCFLKFIKCMSKQMLYGSKPKFLHIICQRNCLEIAITDNRFSNFKKINYKVQYLLKLVWQIWCTTFVKCQVSKMCQTWIKCRLK